MTSPEATCVVYPRGAPVTPRRRRPPAGGRARPVMLCRTPATPWHGRTTA
jgi:hypothetical protein